MHEYFFPHSNLGKSSQNNLASVIFFQARTFTENILLNQSTRKTHKVQVKINKH